MECTLKFVREEADDVIVYNVKLERATMKDSEEFKQILLDDISLGRKKMLVDLSKCSFIDSSFLGALITTVKSATHLGSEMFLVSDQTDILALLELTGTDKLFNLFPTIEEAYKGFSK